LSALLVDGDRLIALAVEPDDVAATAERLGESIIDVHRVGEAGRTVDFRLTGVIGLLGPELPPFFVTTSAGREWRCGFRAARHRAEPRGIRWVEMGGDESKIRTRLLDPLLPLRIVSGRPGVAAVALDIGGAETVVRS
jgi:hypothetical protein